MNSQSLSCRARCINSLPYLQDNSSLSSSNICAFEFRETSSTKITFNVWFAMRAALRGSVLNRCVFSLHPYCLCLYSSLSQKEKSSELDLSSKRLFQPQNITKFNQYVDIFMEEKPTNVYHRCRGLGRSSTLRSLMRKSTVTYMEVPGYQRFQPSFYRA